MNLKDFGFKLSKLVFNFFDNNMEFSKLFLAYFFTLSGYSLRGSLAEFSSEDCTALGYNKANLLCSVCDQLTDFKLDVLKWVII